VDKQWITYKYMWITRGSLLLYALVTWQLEIISPEIGKFPEPCFDDRRVEKLLGFLGINIPNRLVAVPEIDISPHHH
jgi:hypothetical protein